MNGWVKSVYIVLGGVRPGGGGGEEERGDSDSLCAQRDTHSSLDDQHWEIFHRGWMGIKFVGRPGSLAGRDKPYFPRGLVTKRMDGHVG